MRQNQRAIFLAVLASAIFASASAAQTTLRYQFKEGDKIGYVIERKLQTTTGFMGKKDTEASMTMTLDVSWKVVKVDGQGQAQVQIKVGHAKVAMNGPDGKVEVDSKDSSETADPVGKMLGHLAKAMAVMELTGTILPTGEMKDMKASDESAKALRLNPGADKLVEALNPEAFKNWISTLVLPKEPISKGKTWLNKTESKSPLGKLVEDDTCTYEGQADKDGVKVEKISVKPVVKLEAEPNALIKIEVKDSKGSGEVLFDNKMGRLVESVINSRTEFRFNANGENMRQVMDHTVTIRAKKK